MSETKFTPGPWIIDSEWPNNRLPGHAILSASVGMPREHRAMARVVIELDGEPYAEGEANAALIAAAPDLYAALDWLLKDMADYEAWKRPCAAVDAAQAALSKARGET